MVKRSIGERFCVWWWDADGQRHGRVVREAGEDWMQNLSYLLGWPYPVETDNEEGWDGGGA